MLEVEPVSNRKRLVETVVGFERGDDGGIAGRLLAEVRRGRIARDELRQHEDDERDPDREQHERGGAPQDEAEKAR